MHIYAVIQCAESEECLGVFSNCVKALHYASSVPNQDSAGSVVIEQWMIDNPEHKVRLGPVPYRG